MKTKMTRAMLRDWKSSAPDAYDEAHHVLNNHDALLLMRIVGPMTLSEIMKKYYLLAINTGLHRTRVARAWQKLTDEMECLYKRFLPAMRVSLNNPKGNQ